jgi:hypothetical protein
MRSLLYQAVLPVLVLLPAAVALGALMIGQLFPSVELAAESIPACPHGDCTGLDPVPTMQFPAFHEDVPLNWAGLSAVAGAGLLAVVLLAGIAAATLRTRPDLAALRTG